MDNPHVDKDATGKPNTYVFDPTDVQIHEFFFEGAPNPKDLEGVERCRKRKKYYKKDTRI